jgi:hypothetical protein
VSESRKRLARLVTPSRASNTPKVKRRKDKHMLIELARGAARNWCDAWNRRDLDAIMDHYADDVEFSSPTVVKRWTIADGWPRGKGKVRENFAIGVAAPDLHFELMDVLLGVNSVGVVYRRKNGALVTDLFEV